MPRRRVTANRGTFLQLARPRFLGALCPRQGNIALTCADDRTSTAKWSSLGITAQSFNSIGVPFDQRLRPKSLTQAGSRGLVRRRSAAGSRGER